MNHSMLRSMTVVLGLLAAPGLNRHAVARDYSLTLSTDDARVLRDCSQVAIRFGDRGDDLATVRDEQRFTIPKSSVPSLRIRLPGAGGMMVQGWQKDEYSITVCKTAAARQEARARETLEGISSSFSDGQLSVRGPTTEERNWVVYLIVQTPEGATADLETENGEISLREFSGTLRARAENGPVTVGRCSGEIEARTENGPISVVGGRGRLRVSAQNGPISVELASRRWQGAGLVARTENGPLRLRIPPGYRSGITVEATGSSPFSCKASECKQARKTWDEEVRRIEFGEAGPVVRLSTVNGPVSIESLLSEL